MRVMSRFAANAALATAVVAGAALVSAASAANAATFFTTSGEATQSSLGVNGSYLSSLYDQLTVDAVVSGAFQSGQIILNQVEFNVGVNASYVNPTNPGTISETMTVIGLGSAQTLNILFNLAISYSDTLTIFGGTTLTFAGWQVVVNELVIGPNPGGLEFGNLTAQVSQSPSPLFAADVAQTPLPAALPLFATGLGALSLLGWRRKRKNAAALAAA